MAIRWFINETEVQHFPNFLSEFLVNFGARSLQGCSRLGPRTGPILMFFCDFWARKTRKKCKKITFLRSFWPKLHKRMKNALKTWDFGLPKTMNHASELIASKLISRCIFSRFWQSVIILWKNNICFYKKTENESSTDNLGYYCFFEEI